MVEPLAIGFSLSLSYRKEMGGEGRVVGDHMGFMTGGGGGGIWIWNSYSYWDLGKLKELGELRECVGEGFILELLVWISACLSYELLRLGGFSYL